MEQWSIVSLGRGFIGIISILAIAYLFSTNKKAINWKVVGIGLLIQILIAVGILFLPPVGIFFKMAGQMFVKIADFSKEGAAFLLGDLVDLTKTPYIFIFQILPTIIFFSALTSVLYYMGIIQKVVVIIAWALKRTLNVSGAEGLTVAGNIFLGQSEAPLLSKKYLPSMTLSEIFLVMVAGMATIAGGVLAAYVGMLGGADPDARLFYATHLLSASVMAAPAAILLSKIMVPQTEEFNSEMNLENDKSKSNLLGVISEGTSQGISLAVNVAGMLLVIISMIALLNFILGDIIGHYTGLNGLIESWTDGRSVFSLEIILGTIFAPFSWLMGVCASDMALVGELLGKKLIINEFVAYGDLSIMKEAAVFAEQKSLTMSTYILCGFANVSSVGICIGAIGSLAPSQQYNLTTYGFRALIGGALASCLSATIVGMMI